MTDTSDTSDTDTVHAARKAVATAVPFAEHLASMCTSTAAAFRSGNDREALGSVESLFEELEYFIKFTVLIADDVHTAKRELGSDLAAYRERLVSIVESIEPALKGADLVEVADALEFDLAPEIAAYRELDPPIQGVFAAA